MLEIETRILTNNDVLLEEIHTILEHFMIQLDKDVLTYQNISIPNLSYERIQRDEKLKEHYDNVVLPLLKERYFHTNDIDETDMFLRVAHSLGASEIETDIFYYMMRLRLFLPATPTLMNAGRGKMLSSCFVIQPEDDMVSITDYWKDMAMIQKYGGGVGTDWSKIRPKGSAVNGTGGIASGFEPFLQVANAINKGIKQGSVRSGANASTMRITHPEIETFLNLKNTEKKARDLSFFNLSVTVFDDEFVKMTNDKNIDLIFNNKHFKSVNGGKLLRDLATSGWTTGDPSLYFLDRVNSGFWKENVMGRADPFGGYYGYKMTHNPCGEQSLPNYGACNLGSMNLIAFYNPNVNEFNYEFFVKMSRMGLRFLDTVIDINWFPNDKLTKQSQHLRNVGLGYMGLADLMYAMEIEYGSVQSISLTKTITELLTESAMDESELLAYLKGSAPVFDEEVMMRNTDFTCIAPTGSIAMIGMSSHGIEPHFFLSYEKLVYPKGKSEDDGVYITVKPPVLNLFTRKIPKTAQQITPLEHIKILSVVSQNVTNAVSKTVNLPNEATVEDIIDIYKYAFAYGCKSVTVFRDGCRNDLAIKKKDTKTVNLLSIGNNTELDGGSCPVCENGNIYSVDGCRKCDTCEWSTCSS